MKGSCFQPSYEINFIKILTNHFIYHIFAFGLGVTVRLLSQEVFLPINMEGYFNGGQGEQLSCSLFLFLFPPCKK